MTMEDFYFCLASIMTALVMTGVPVRYYLQVTRSLGKEKWLYKVRDKLKALPVIALAGSMSFCLSLFLNNHTGAYISFLVTAASISISVISVLATLTAPHCREAGKSTAEFKFFGFIVTAIWTLTKVVVRLQSGEAGRTKKNDFKSPTLEGYDSPQKNFDRNIAMGRIDSYGRFKD